jgi:hypothetical protein
MRKRVMLLMVCGCLGAVVSFQIYGGAADAPSRSVVIEEHEKLLQKYGLKKMEGRRRGGAQQPQTQREHREQQEERRGFSFSDFAEWVKNLSLPVIILIVAVLVLLFYFAFRGSSGLLPSQRAGPVIRKPEEEAHEEPEDSKARGPYQRALELARKGELGKALIVLHKSSLRVLQGIHLVPPGRNFTNNQVKQLLRRKEEGSGMVTPFGRLAMAAERVAFKGEDPGEQVFSDMKRLYERSFLDKEDRL